MNLEQNILQIPVNDIIPNRFQPRLEFNDRGLEELASSIKQHGIIQPLVLRRVEDKYEIIAGERRYKAAIMAGLETVPAIIANVDDNKSAEVAIVENVQRRDLTSIEEARSYMKLIDKGYSQTDIAKKMGISQSAIANKLRLLNLDEEVQTALLKNEISERHARSLLTLSSSEEQKEWLRKIKDERLTVRNLDEALKEYNNKDNSIPEVVPQVEVQTTVVEQKNEPIIEPIPIKEEIKEPEESDIPLVRPLDIEAIKKEATELPKINGDNNIARKLEEIEREKMFNPDVIPVEQASNNSKTNFFNFLENEQVNMNVEETNLKAPVIDIARITPSVEEQSENTTDDNEGTSLLTPNFGNIKEEIEEPQNNDIFDPVSLIPKLDPNYQEQVEKKLGIDLKSAINEIRNVKDTLSDKGFNITLEESDLHDLYQFTIKIKKD